MKEESKKKKTTTKKTTNTKKSASVKSTTKKTTSTKAKKKKKRVITRISKDELKYNDEIEIKEKENNKDVMLRAILAISYLLIILILVIGFLEPYVNHLKVESNYKPAYLVEEEILDEDNIIKLEDAEDVLGELDGDYFVYIGYTKMHNSDVQTLDMGIANLINNYGLKDKFYYINIDSILSKKNRVDLVNYYLAYKDVLVTKIPTIIYVNSENIVRPENIITRDDDKLITVGDFQKLLDINQFVVKK